MLQNAVSDLCLHCLLTGTSIYSEIELIFSNTPSKIDTFKAFANRADPDQELLDQGLPYLLMKND